MHRDDYRAEPLDGPGHMPPNRAEVAACQHWLELELRLVKPGLVVALGATAAQALLGPSFRVTVERGGSW